MNQEQLAETEGLRKIVYKSEFPREETPIYRLFIRGGGRPSRADRPCGRDGQYSFNRNTKTIEITDT